MNPILDPAGGRPAAVYWRRRAVFFAALAVVLLLMVRACGGDGPNLSKTAVQQEVPLVSTFTPTPSATATQDGSATPTGTPSSDPAIGDDPANPYNPCETDVSDGPVVDPALTDEAGQPLCETGTATATSKPSATVRPTATTAATKGPKATAAPTTTAKPTSDGQAAGPLSCAKSVLAVRLKADKRVYAPNEKPKLYLGVKNSGSVACLADMGSRALSFTIISGRDRIWSSDDCQGKGTSDIRLLKPGQTLWARAVWGKVRSQPGCPKGQPTAKPGTYVVEGSAGGVKSRKRAVFQI